MSNTEQKKIKIYFIPILIIALLTALDQLTKTIIVGKFAVQESIDVIKGVFTITYVQNRGIAWGMLEGNPVFVYDFFDCRIMLLCLSKYFKLSKIQIVSYLFNCSDLRCNWQYD